MLMRAEGVGSEGEVLDVEGGLRCCWLRWGEKVEEELIACRSRLSEPESLCGRCKTGS